MKNMIAVIIMLTVFAATVNAAEGINFEEYVSNVEGNEMHMSNEFLQELMFNACTSISVDDIKVDFTTVDVDDVIGIYYIQEPNTSLLQKHVVLSMNDNIYDIDIEFGSAVIVGD